MRSLTIPHPSKGDLVSNIGIGCMRFGSDVENTEKAVLAALESGYNFFDHADIYGRGECERTFAEVLKRNPKITENMVIQSKCGIVPGERFDFSYEQITCSVDGILQRLGLDMIDGLLLHRPDILCEPDEVARAFDDLEKSGKVRWFGVSNHTPLQIELLKKSVEQPIVVNQIELSLKALRAFNEGIDFNRQGEFATTVGILDYCQLNNILIQAWSPLAGASFTPGREEVPTEEIEGTAVMEQLCKKYDCMPAAIKVAWLLRHPSNMQVIIGSVNAERIQAAAEGSDIRLTRDEWYQLYIAARGKRLP